MERRTKVTVHPPDDRGLREVRVGRETVGSAWSLRELRGILRRHGHPEDLDPDDRSAVSWLGGGSDTWPDRTWHRRATIGLMAAGLVGGWALLTAIGIPDAFEALTFAGRITGFVFLLGGVAEAAAAVAVFDYWGKRGLKISGAIVSVGVLIALTVTTMLVFLWFQEMEYTDYTRAFFPLFVWSLWALYVVIRAKAWRGTPHPTKIAAGVTATALLAAVNIAYSAVYQPTAAPANLALTVRFGVPRADLERPVVQLPVTLHLRNSGSVPVYVLGDNWSVFGRSGKYVEKSDGLRDLRPALEASREHDASRMAGSFTWDTLAAGPFTGPGTWFDPGEEYTEEKVVQISKGAKYDVVDADLDVMVMRKDRGKIDLDAFGIEQYSWDEESVVHCLPKDCGENLLYHAQVRYNNNLVNVTRKPRYVTSWWGLNPTGSGWDASISTFKGKGLINDEETQREYRRFDLFTVEAHTAVPFAAIVSSPRP
ncbi:hypothetical protein ACIGEZ_13080 [Streptomyces sp. NPDC085481]|uniref:hypothetical protein n=1 Tax=Streptomyces sp. NPDC085481 TaxID=3365727 RepID=UPI0037D52C0A